MISLERVWGNFGDAGAFQLSLFSFVYFLFTQLSSLFPKILKLTQIWE